MVLVLKKGDNLAKIEKLIKKLVQRDKKKGVDISKYAGKLTSLKEDALKLQKKLRDEWR